MMTGLGLLQLPGIQVYVHKNEKLELKNRIAQECLFFHDSVSIHNSYMSLSINIQCLPEGAL